MNVDLTFDLTLMFFTGTLESRSGNVTNARLLFAAGITKCPHHVPLYQAWASLEIRDGDILTAKRLIGEALTRNKRNGLGWLIAARIEEQQENHGLVGLILRRGIECAPMDVDLYSALADHEIKNGRINRVSLLDLSRSTCGCSVPHHM
jgi:hypothetical protein